jgi:cobalt-zinc-cadmium resistance protein CzcA
MFSTILTLFVLPVLYSILEKRSGKLKPVHIGSLILIVLFFVSGATQAQVRVSLTDAVTLAQKNNSRMKIARLNEEYHEVLKKSSFDPDRTNLGFEYGQMNSISNDTKFSVSQTIQFPSVYKYQRDVNNSNYRISILTTRLEGSTLKAEVKGMFYDLVILQERKKLLLQASEIYTEFVKKADQRFRLGDADVLERSTAISQQLQIQYQMRQLITEYEAKLNEFQVILNSNEVLAPAIEQIVYSNQVNPDSGLSNSPTIVIKTEQLRLSQHSRRLEKSKLFPWLSAGYNNLSIMGYQKINNEERYFNRANRFSYFSLGIGIPIFNTAQRARVKAVKLQATIREMELYAAEKKLSVQVNNAFAFLNDLQTQLISYQTTLLPNAFVIMESASKRLQAGEIGYLDWVILINQSIGIRGEYLNAVKRHNEVAFEIEKLTGQ